MNTTFKCSFDEFFLACRLVLISVQDNLASFTDHKTFYTAAFIDGLLTELDALELLPNEEQRQGQRERLLVNIKGKTRKDVKKIEQRLKTYIEESFIKAEQKSALEEAGFTQYEKAMEYNWEDVKGLLNSGVTFINTHNGVLTSPGGMPAVYVTDYTALKTEMVGKITTFLGLKQGTKEMTEARTVACNEFYEKIRKIMNDGQAIFIELPAKRDRFIWESVLKTVTPPGAAGLRGTIKDGLTLEPIGGALVEWRDGVNPVIEKTTNALGRYDSGNLPAGSYTVKITKAGYAVIEATVEIKLGTVSYKHWLMTEAVGNQVIVEGSFGVNEIANIPKPAGVNDDTSMEMEVFDTQAAFFASNTVDGDVTGTGTLYAEDGVPLEEKWSQVVAQIGLNAEHPFYNVKNVGASAGSWRVTFFIA